MGVKTYTCEVTLPVVRSWSPRKRRVCGWVVGTAMACVYYVSFGMLVMVPYYALTRRGWNWRMVLVALVVLCGVEPRGQKSQPRFGAVGQLLYEGVRHNLSERAKKSLGSLEDRFIFGLHPHGSIPLHQLMVVALLNQHCSRGLSIGVASILTRLPLLRTFVGWLGGVPADYETLKRTLQHNNLYLTPGGLAEMFAEHEGDVVYIRQRTGVFRLALETGARLVPVYVFNNDMFRWTTLPPLARLSRRLRVALVVVYGRFGLPVPRKQTHPVLVAFGEPLPSVGAAGPVPTCQEIIHLQHRYEAELLRIFNDFKATAGKLPTSHLTVR